MQITIDDCEAIHHLPAQVRRLTPSFLIIQNKPMKKLTLALLTVAITATGAFAGSGKTFKEVVTVVTDDCAFRANELQVDAFASALFYNSGRPGWGGGLGINYFLTEYIGIGLEQGIDGRESSGGSSSYAEWTTIGNLFLRYPICSLNLAPYGLVGGGAGYAANKSGHGFGHVGGGLEYRVTDNIGLFSDARYAYSSEEPKTAVIGRAGVRFAF